MKHFAALSAVLFCISCTATNEAQRHRNGATMLAFGAPMVIGGVGGAVSGGVIAGLGTTDEAKVVGGITAGVSVGLAIAGGLLVGAGARQFDEPGVTVTATQAAAGCADECRASRQKCRHTLWCDDRERECLEKCRL